MLRADMCTISTLNSSTRVVGTCMCWARQCVVKRYIHIARKETSVFSEVEMHNLVVKRCMYEAQVDVYI